MSILSSASMMLLRHHNKFTKRRIVFSGNLQDTLSVQLETESSYIHTQQYHQWETLNQILQTKVYFSLLPISSILDNCDTLIYYWPNNKKKAQFQLQNLLSLLRCGSDIFIVGGYSSGIRSAHGMVKNWVNMIKIDSAHRCGLYYGSLARNSYFNPSEFWHEHLVEGITLKSLPGVFGYNGLDNGTELLLSTFREDIEGKILDIGCGTGVISAIIASRSPSADIILTDVNAAALAASKATLLCNNLKGTVLASNVYSKITGCFNMIVANPPFHDGSKVTLDIAQTLIKDAPNFLYKGGELRIVANSFLPYHHMLNKVFGHHKVIIYNKYFKVYSAIKNN
ncbi:16S rRNA (guanine(1207)-N(2))-methyltransferase RsmC [Candidatus Erwinia haradaeae]|uniref:Ribosomal RNA small subunit methyltransferase C n=1 Tax=Candidatus Erwinia haradaeae TaxID=1922217 RepID=A0A451D419_9GAMM|nr:16S rRNA (guanine(1207)-N(2))-methyltransferase RsmC [Candidatus Erwinia haradaeae]VFP80423.1 Ribosomal RNA small subunit methyltransferase C [Candidatus Erwinia haradaeae]